MKYAMRAGRFDSARSSANAVATYPAIFLNAEPDRGGNTARILL
jgi:hypothetical protein